LRSLLSAAAVLSAALLAGCDIEADFSDSVDVVTLNADEYRIEIASIDQLLFAESPLGEDGAQSLSEKFAALSTRVAAHDPQSKFLKVESLEIRLMAERAKRLSPNGTGVSLQNHWMRIRNNLFDDRAWFVRSAADLDYARSVVPLSEGKSTTTQKPLRRELHPRTTTDAGHRDVLRGRWQVVGIETGGKPSNDKELANSIWVFEPPRLTMQPPEGETSIYTYTALAEDDGNYLSVTAAAEDGWMKYELKEGALRVAFFDGLRGRPTSFSAVPGQKDPLLVIVRLRPI
jgi:uncharacterized protein (TIGR03067 family)